jgi:hypothetical protein
MQTEEKKDNGTKTKGADFGCCNPENFKEMFEKMGKCFPSEGDATDFFSMKGDMMKNMMEMCFPPKTTDTKEDTELQKDQEEKTESTDEKGCCS